MTESKQFKALLFSLKPINKEYIAEIYGVNAQAKNSFQLLDIVQNEDISLNAYNCYFVLDIKVSALNAQDLEWRECFDSICHQLQCDYCLLNTSTVLVTPTFTTPRLAVFDMDSTLIPMEVIDELAEEAGVKDKVAHITESAMRGALDFNQSFEQRLSLLKGMPYEAVEAVRDRLRFNSGVESFINYLVGNDATIGIASGGFEPFAHRLSGMTTIHKIKANQLEFNDGLLTGRAVKPIVNAEVKAETFDSWRKQLGLAKTETIAIGDGANDCLMLDSAGLGIAYKAKPYLRQRADCVLQFAEMDALSDILDVAISNFS